ncbi:MAG TPA: CpsD/CapB family tyrosine-protein kinase [Thermomicrobiaceae bacterium]|nr:CpsD/CapB family tyrosine-protein kinase [Thermomicrobiaceae bacterium]
MSQTQDRAEQRNPARGATAAPNLVVVGEPASPVAEAYRSLRATVKFSGLLPPLRALLLADAGTGGQHTTVSANLAAALALAGDSTILVDADLHAPRLHELFGLANEVGVGEWLTAGDATAPLPLRESGLPGLRLLSAGHLPVGGRLAPSDLLSGEAGAWLLERLRQEADFVVLDAAPLPETADALALAARVDGVLLLVRSGTTKRATARRAKGALERVGAHIVGAVLTDASGRLRG